MRRSVALFMVLAVVASLGAPAVAGGKKKKISGSFGASLAPFPKLAAAGDAVGLTKPGCTAGEENVHWVGHEFTPPAKGTLKLSMEGFTGDHDEYVFVGDLLLARGDQEQVGQGMAPPNEDITVSLKAKQTVLLVACNWLGQPDVEAHYEFTFTK
ncbi:MAG TPA: hypothetical protein VE174_14725 [Actinomycetota bacterium]|nr:hypothetical protein [Actinomycetota bacterium]